MKRASEKNSSSALEALMDAYLDLSDPNNNSHNKSFQQLENERFHKTRLCIFHQKGACAKGDKCTYAHSELELQAPPDLLKTRLCHDWLSGKCTSAARCRFAHGRSDLRQMRSPPSSSLFSTVAALEDLENHSHITTTSCCYDESAGNGSLGAFQVQDLESQLLKLFSLI